MAQNQVLIYTVFAEIDLTDNPTGENSSSGPFKAGQWSAVASVFMFICSPVHTDCKGDIKLRLKGQQKCEIGLKGTYEKLSCSEHDHWTTISVQRLRT